MRKLMIGCICALTGTAALAALLPHAAPQQPKRYELHFAIDHQIYVTDHDMSADDCLAVLDSVAHDPDSFRHGAGVYTCVRQPRKVNKR